MKYEVTRSHWDGERRTQELLVFDADSFAVLDYQTDAVLMFADVDGNRIGAVNGFDHVEQVEDDDDKDPEEVDGSLGLVDDAFLDSSTWVPRARPPGPDTMAA